MRAIRRAAVGVLALLAVAGARDALAQGPPGSIPPPPVSPYLNILRGGAPPGVNYYNLVQPQLQFYSAINQLQYQQQQQQAALLTGSANGTITGHPVQFSNLSHFYPASPFGGRTALGFRGSPSGQGAPQGGTSARTLGTPPTAFPLRQR